MAATVSEESAASIFREEAECSLETVSKVVTNVFFATLIPHWS
jgi:hypothetical protein